MVFGFESIVYDVNCKSSFDHLQNWLNECESCTDQAEHIIKLLVANKIDLVLTFATSVTD